MRRSIRACLLCPAALFLAASFSAAQSRATTGDLTGLVIDQSKAVLPGVVITASNRETNLVRSTTTGETGHFSLPALQPGTYTLRAELPGFTPRMFDDVIITLGSSIDVEMMLAVAGTQEAITVAAEAPIADTRKTAIASVVSQTQIENLPINGRNFISFSIITPGVTTDRTPQQGASATSGLTFAGQRARSNNITVDGVDNNDGSVGSVRATFSQEAVREFQVLTNSYSAEFGRASGGVVNIVTKSGTNTPFGNAFWYVRDETLNAREHFEKFDPFGTPITREKAPYSQQQFGGTLGGPIARDRTFFFLSFERLDIAANNFVTIDDTTPVTVFGQPFGTPAAILRRAGFPVETGNVPYAMEANQFLAKGDQAFGGNHQLAVRYNYAGTLNENIEPFGGIVARSRGGALDSTDHMAAASHTGVLSSTIVNEVRFQYARRDQSVNALDPRCGGPCVNDDQGGPTLEIPGVASVGRHRFTPQLRHNRLYQVLDSLSLYRGTHQFKAGFDFRHVEARRGSLPLHFGGRYIFQPISAALAPLLGLPGPISAVQALALSLPLAYVQGYGDPLTDYTTSDVSLFAQDEWRIEGRRQFNGLPERIHSAEQRVRPEPGGPAWSAAGF
jgi:Carboxypeptidase regulatory-like domain/TonB-dependent Receptor Plug Domain